MGKMRLRAQETVTCSNQLQLYMLMSAKKPKVSMQWVILAIDLVHGHMTHIPAMDATIDWVELTGSCSSTTQQDSMSALLIGPAADVSDTAGSQYGFAMLGSPQHTTW